MPQNNIQLSKQAKRGVLRPAKLVYYVNQTESMNQEAAGLTTGLAVRHLANLQACASPGAFDLFLEADFNIAPSTGTACFACFKSI